MTFRKNSAGSSQTIHREQGAVTCSYYYSIPSDSDNQS